MLEARLRSAERFHRQWYSIRFRAGKQHERNGVFLEDEFGRPERRLAGGNTEVRSQQAASANPACEAQGPAESEGSLKGEGVGPPCADAEKQ